MTTTLQTRCIANARISTWRIDDDGMLRVTIDVLKEGVYPYAADEAGAEAALPGVDPVQEFIPASEFTAAALATLEGKPVVVNAHEWRDAQNTLVDGLTVGNMAGAPTVAEGDRIRCDALIYDPDTIKAITEEEDPRKRLVEVSAGYVAELEIGEGTHAGRPYHGTQRNLRFNHVLLLPEGAGRCGYDVRIINSRGGASPAQEETMPTTLKVKIGNKTKTYRFTNEEDAQQAENMLEEEKAFNAEAVQTAIAGKTELEAQIAELQKQLAEHDGNLQAAKKQIEDLLSPAAQEAMANEVAEQKEAENSIVEEEAANTAEESGEPAAEQEKEEFGNALKKCNSLADRRKCVVSRIMNKRGQRMDNWSQDAIDGAFETLAVNAKTRAEARGNKPRVLNGIRVNGADSVQASSPRDRMLRPMKLRNAKPADNTAEGR